MLMPLDDIIILLFDDIIDFRRCHFFALISPLPYFIFYAIF